MAVGNQASRYPDFRPNDVTNPNEMSKKLNELTRAIDDKDKRGINPYDVTGRAITVNQDNLVYQGGTEYSFDIPRDAGTIFLSFPTLYSDVLVRVYLPDSSSVEGRTIAIVVETPLEGQQPTTYQATLQVAQGSLNTFSTDTTTTAVTLNTLIQVRAYNNRWLIIAKD